MPVVGKAFDGQTIALIGGTSCIGAVIARPAAKSDAAKSVAGPALALVARPYANGAVLDIDGASALA